MQAIRLKKRVSPQGQIVLPAPGLKAGTPVEVIVLVPDTKDDAEGLLFAAESSLAFWDNPADDEVWNRG
jgi:bifunctional DNA-binding transcriptional regulator/antitoxin component of YhaV-PrlF toxin-antitoxin module